MLTRPPLVEPERLVEVLQRFRTPAVRPELHEGTNYHWFWFLEYVQLELEAGGPDPQIRTTAEALRAFDDEQAVRYAGAFVNCYTCAGAAAQWSWLVRGLPIDEAWLQVHWGPGLPIRKERRAVKGRTKFLEAWRSWLEWCEAGWPLVRHADGPMVWDSLEGAVRYSGRYALMKTVELLHQRGLVDACQFDVRPHDAKYPRKTLAKLFPDFAPVLLQKFKHDDALTQRLASVVKEWLEQALERPLSWYQLETVLCTYRQACGQNKYPGRSQDRELNYFRQAEAYWHALGVNLLEHFSFYTVRHRVFDDVWLGERGGWTGPRPELEDVWVARYPEGVAY